MNVHVRRSLLTTALAVLSAVVIAGCASSDDLERDAKADAKAELAASAPIVVGSQDYYSNEIVAEIYAQALEAADFTVKRDLRIGQREVYIKEIENGSIDVFPEYTGNLLQHYDPSTKATTSEDVFAALTKVLPDGLRVLDQSPATDQDSYNVTQQFATEHDVTSLADLADVDEQLTLGGNSELRTRPYGPKGLKDVYGVSVDFTPIEDSGGALTLKALKDGDVQLVNIFSADPKIADSKLVTLADPKGLFLASNLVPVVSDRVDDAMAKVIDAVSAKLTPEGLVALNAKSVNDELSARDIAASWLDDNGLG